MAGDKIIGVAMKEMAEVEVIEVDAVKNEWASNYTIQEIPASR